MLALFLFAVVEEDVDESAAEAEAVEDMEVLTTLDKAAVAAVAVAAALRTARILFCLLIIDLHSRKAEWKSVICQIS